MPNKQPKKQKNILQASVDGYVEGYNLTKHALNKVKRFVTAKVRK